MGPGAPRSGTRVIRGCLISVRLHSVLRSVAHMIPVTSMRKREHTLSLMIQAQAAPTGGSVPHDEEIAPYISRIDRPGDPCDLHLDRRLRAPGRPGGRRHRRHGIHHREEAVRTLSEPRILPSSGRSRLILYGPAAAGTRQFHEDVRQRLDVGKRRLRRRRPQRVPGNKDHRRYRSQR